MYPVRKCFMYGSSQHPISRKTAFFFLSKISVHSNLSSQVMHDSSIYGAMSIASLRSHMCTRNNTWDLKWYGSVIYIVTFELILIFADILPISVSDWLDDVRYLSKDHLKNLYRILDISQQDVEKAEEKIVTLTDIDLQIMAVLQLWLIRNGKKANQQVLLQAIKESRPSGKY